MQSCRLSLLVQNRYLMFCVRFQSAWLLYRLCTFYHQWKQNIGQYVICTFVYPPLNEYAELQCGGKESVHSCAVHLVKRRAI